MQIKIIKKDSPRLGLLNSLIAILFGIFITSVIFALFLKILETTGLWLASALCIVIIFCGFYYIKKRTFLRIMTWGMLGTILIGGAGLLIGISVLSNLLENF